MIGIVLVSHSPKLAEAALELAREMVPGDEPHVKIAAGTSEGGIGTDATTVAEAITEVASADGVLVIMDLGSAVLSAELALEFVDDAVLHGGEVRLTPAPILEGLLAALVVAAGGAGLDEVDREARGALAAKESQFAPSPTPLVELVETTPAHRVSTSSTSGGSTSGSSDVIAQRFTLTNESGLHARPASQIVSAVSGLDARVTVSTEGKKPADARSPIGLMALGVHPGQEMVVEASGPQAAEALAAIAALVVDRFGEPAAGETGLTQP